MYRPIEEMLKNYEVETRIDRKNAIKEIIQEIVLCGLSRAGIFRHAAFYGGTALRIFHGLDRFSEDMDFSLITKNPEFSLGDYVPILEKEVRSFGINFGITEKQKRMDNHIQSAFLKGNTREHILLFFSDSTDVKTTPMGEVIKIKLELDDNPPAYATFERKYRLLPAPYEVNLYDLPSLFSGKIHAVLCRSWQKRVKGRDLYDYVFYLSKKVSFNHKHFVERVKETNSCKDEVLDLSGIKNLLCERFDQIDYVSARKDVEPFIKDSSMLDLWSADFFKSITEALTSI